MTPQTIEQLKNEWLLEEERGEYSSPENGVIYNEELMAWWIDKLTTILKDKETQIAELKPKQESVENHQSYNDGKRDVIDDVLSILRD